MNYHLSEFDNTVEIPVTDLPKCQAEVVAYESLDYNGSTFFWDWNMVVPWVPEVFLALLGQGTRAAKNRARKTSGTQGNMVTAETVKVIFEKNNRFFGLRNEEAEIVWETGSDTMS